MPLIDYASEYAFGVRSVDSQNGPGKKSMMIDQALVSQGSYSRAVPNISAHTRNRADY